MTVLIPLIVAAALGLAFTAYKHPQAYRVMFIFALPVLVTGGFLVFAIKLGGFAYLVFLMFLPDLLDLGKDRHHTST